MNFYTLFYWFTVADKVRGFFDVFSNIFTTFAIIFLIVFGFLIIVLKSDPNYNDEDEIVAMKYWITTFRKLAIWTTILATITWAGFVFVPTKKEMVLIVAGGAVGNFITQDSTAKQLPHDVMVFLQSEIRNASKEAKAELLSDPKLDSLKQMTKEQLIEKVLQK